MRTRIAHALTGRSETPASGTTSTTGAPATAAAGCTLPLTHDALDGFHIAVPSGWDLFTFNSTIVVSKDPSLNTEETNVTAVLMTPGLTPASVFTSSLSGMQKQLAASGATMTDVIDGIHIDKQSSVQSPDQQLPNGGIQGEVQVEFVGNWNGTAIHGSVKVVSATGFGDTPGGVIRLGVATPEMWNSLNGALTHVRESIQHDITLQRDRSGRPGLLRQRREQTADPNPVGAPVHQPQPQGIWPTVGLGYPAPSMPPVCMMVEHIHTMPEEPS